MNHRGIWRWVLFAQAGLLALSAGAAEGLEKYVQAADPSYHWEVAYEKSAGEHAITHLKMTSQTWRTNVWTHDIHIVRPAKVRHPEIAFLFIMGSGEGTRQTEMLTKLADRAGAVAAVVTSIPNQPLYGGRREDALIAYTFQQYLQTGDDTWPLLFPMAKTAVRAMDSIQALEKRDHNEAVQKFVVAGASKRGWTTWLTAAVDQRVAAIAPMVIDMLNMKVQTQWALKVYGRQSEQIRDYTETGLIDQLDDPPMVRLRSWVDPYSYRSRYNLPKLLLLGTNDRYWTVDSLRHYWNDLPEPKLVFQTPNAGHNLNGGGEATETLAAFFQMVADHEELPRMEWQLSADGHPHLHVKVNRAAKAIHLWTADSTDRDFRDDKWTARDVEIKPGSSIADVDVDKPATGYRAFMGEVVLKASTGDEYKLSTQVQVVPDEK